MLNNKRKILITFGLLFWICPAISLLVGTVIYTMALGAPLNKPEPHTSACRVVFHYSRSYHCGHFIFEPTLDFVCDSGDIYSHTYCIFL